MHDDDLTQKRINSNLKFLRIDPDDDLNKLIKANDEILNNITNNYDRYIYTKCSIFRKLEKRLQLLTNR